MVEKLRKYLLFFPGRPGAAWAVPALLGMVCLWLASPAQAAALVFQSDFGLKDGAVAAMKGVAVSVAPNLFIYDITHEIPPFNIWEGALRLEQAAAYWPAGTVFVSVVDPGVGTDRRSVVLKTRSGHFFVSPDNGSLTFVAESLGVESVCEIDETVNRLAGSGNSHTFHGRDVYAYTGARLAAGLIGFEQVGADCSTEVYRIPHQPPVIENGVIWGGIPILDVQYGNVWTNIGQALFEQLGVVTGGRVRVRIFSQGDMVVDLKIPYAATFGGVSEGKPLLYLNSLGNVALGVNQGSFSEQFRVKSGPDWSIQLDALNPPK